VNTIVREGKISDLKQYTHFLQKIYEKTYTNKKIGLTRECFSVNVFNTENTQNYLKINLNNTDTQITLLTFIDEKMIGSITLQDIGLECELRGFYIASDYQGKGIGKMLFEKAKQFCIKKDIVLDIYTHNKKTINIYKKWGFVIDIEKGSFYRHWDEWPEGIKAKSIYMRLKR